MAADYGAFDDAPAAAESVPEIGVTVRIVQARNLVGLSGPNQPFNALVSTKLLAEHAIETPPVMTADGGVHRFDHSTTLSFPHDAVREPARYVPHASFAPLDPAELAAAGDARARALTPPGVRDARVAARRACARSSC